MMRRAQPLLGTFFEITVTGPSQSLEQEAIDNGFAEATRLEQMLSIYRPESEVVRLNDLAATFPQSVSPELYELLTFCIQLEAQAPETFSIITPLDERQCKMPILLRDGAVFFNVPLKIDLGGVAKGFIVDRTLQRLLTYPVTEIVVNAGGDLATARSSGTQIAIRDPRSPSQPIEAVTLAGGAIATSAPYFDLSRTRRPLTGELVRELKSVSVIAGSCMTADALTKVALLHEGDCSELMRKYGATALVFSSKNDGSIHRKAYG